MTEEIKNALLILDPAADDQWTQAGLPSIDSVKGLSGLSDITRDDVTKAWPEFNREFAKGLMDDADATDNGMKPLDDDADVIETNAKLGDSVVTDEVEREDLDAEDLEEILEMSSGQIDALNDDAVEEVFQTVLTAAEEVEEEIAQLKSLLRRLAEQQEVVHTIRNARKPKVTHADNVAAYFAAQDKVKAKATEAVADLVDKGIDPKLAKMAVDAKMGKRRTGKRESKAQRFLNKKV